MSKVVLGRGLDALIPTEAKPAHKGDERFRIVQVEHIAPNPMQPRREFDQVSLQQLADSFKQNGIMQPLVVTKSPEGYTIVAGERRLRAAKLANLTEVPIVLTDEVDETRMLEMALVENVQREDLNSIEIAEAYYSLMEKCGLTQNELSARVGKSRTAVANTLRLLTLPDEIKQMIRDGRLSEGHARAILAAGTPEAMLSLARRAISESLPVREVERRVKDKKSNALTQMKRKDPVLADTETYLKQLFGTAVRIHHGHKKGHIEIEYYGNQDLDRLLTLFHRISS